MQDIIVNRTSWQTALATHTHSAVCYIIKEHITLIICGISATNTRYWTVTIIAIAVQTREASFGRHERCITFLAGALDTVIRLGSCLAIIKLNILKAGARQIEHIRC